MLNASAFPEVWPAGPATRPCYGSYFQHPLTAQELAIGSGPVYYDNYGHCVPGLAVAPTVFAPVSTGPSIWTLLAIGGIAYLAWRYRKKIF